MAALEEILLGVNACVVRNLWFMPLDEAIASNAVFVIVSGSAETLLEPAKQLKNGKI